jgi:hypothetical protein
MSSETVNTFSPALAPVNDSVPLFVSKAVVPVAASPPSCLERP